MLNIFCGATLFAQDKDMFEVLKSNRNTNNIFIVPDKYALTTEKNIFDSLDIKSAFDLDVLTLSRLASKIMPDFSDINKTTGVMIVKKILLDNKPKFKCFNKTLLSAGFSEDLYNTINQLKSCGVQPESIVFENPTDYLQLKMNDIALVYTEYQKYLALQGLKDSSDKFDEFEKHIKSSDFIKNSNIYISHFDSMTLQGYKIVEQLILCAKSVNIAVTKAPDTINNHIYQNDMYNTIMGIANKLNVKPTIYNCDTKTVGQFRHLEQNLFSYKPHAYKVNSSNIEIYEHLSLQEELTQIATKIIALTKQGYRYKDICVAVPSLQNNKDLIEKIFSAFNLSYYIDASQNYQQTVVYNLLNKAFNLCNRYFRKQDIIAFAKNIFVENFDSDKFEDFINKYSLQGSAFINDCDYIAKDEYYPQYLDIRKYLLKGIMPLYQVLSNPNRVSDITNKIYELLTYFDVENKINALVTEFNKTNLKLAKIFPQLLKALDETMQGLNKVLGEVELDSYSFVDILNSGLQSVTLSTVPLSCDNILVADASKSMFDRPKVLFVAGACENELPYYKQDCGIITDNEIDILSVRYQIEPSIKTINLRERFKLFNMLTSVTDKLFISYHLKNGNNKVFGASWVEQVKNMFLVPYKEEYVKLDTYTSDYNTNSFVENLACQSNAQTKLIDYIRLINDGYRFTNELQISTLKNVLKQDFDYTKLLDYDNSNKKISKNLFFDKGTLSVSQIERFYECPFKHFVDYGLKLKQKTKSELDSLNVGNILHEVVQKFVYKIKDNLAQDVESLASDLFEHIVSKQEYVNIINAPQNKMQLVSLKKEAVRLCRGITYQLQNSDFKPLYTEARFGDNGKIQSLVIEVGDLSLKVVGAVDRIDVLDNYFRIIDYKTGNCDSNINQLYYGKKLQLYVYQKVVNTNLNLKPAGNYYFPVTNKYEDENDSFESLYKLKGYTLNQDSVILGSDKNLLTKLESDLIEVKRKTPTKKQEFSYNKYSKLLTQDELLGFANYAIEMLKNAVKNINHGVINPSPLKIASDRSSCEFCPYKSICRFDEKLNNKTRHVKNNATIQNIKEAGNGTK